MSVAGARAQYEDMTDLFACHECDLLNRLPPLPPHGTATCVRCQAPLLRHKPNSIERALALALAGLILFIVANSFPFLGLRSAGMVHQTTLGTGVLLLFRQGMFGLASLVALTCLVVPAVQLLLLLYLLVPLHGNRVPWQAPKALHLLGHLQPWSMLEVFMIGILVTLVKLGHSVEILPGISIWAFGALILVLAGMSAALDYHLLWDRIEEGA